MVAEGQPAPDFTLPSDTGEAVTLSSITGKPVVVYFYPVTTRDQRKQSAVTGWTVERGKG